MQFYNNRTIQTKFCIINELKKDLEIRPQQNDLQIKEEMLLFILVKYFPVVFTFQSLSTVKLLHSPTLHSRPAFNFSSTV